MFFSIIKMKSNHSVFLFSVSFFILLPQWSILRRSLRRSPRLLYPNGFLLACAQSLADTVNIPWCRVDEPMTPETHNDSKEAPGVFTTLEDDEQHQSRKNCWTCGRLHEFNISDRLSTSVHDVILNMSWAPLSYRININSLDKLRSSKMRALFNNTSMTWIPRTLGTDSPDSPWQHQIKKSVGHNIVPVCREFTP